MIDKTKIAIKANRQYSNLFKIWFKDYHSKWAYNGDWIDWYYFIIGGIVYYKDESEIPIEYKKCEITDLFEI